MEKVVIGGGQGFWGDSNDAAVHMVKHGGLNYMACDYLAELTLSIMARQKLRNPQAGYARDFIGLLSECITDAQDKGVRILSNAGGMNIEGCVNEIANTFRSKGLSGRKIGYVLGDDMTGEIDRMMAEGITFDNIDGVGDFNEIKDKIVNANVYYGHEPIIECLSGDADVIVTGRATDSALFLSPLMYELGIKEDDWTNIARGIMAGHLLECGGQGAGGNFEYGWRDVPDMDQLGFPIAEFSMNDLIITKAPNCGGLITEQSCKEQILYEIHNPASYVTPDVIADISKVTLTQVGKDRVAVDGIRGKKRPDTLKLSIGYHAGYKVAAMLSFAWPDAYEKAQKAADILMKKMGRKNLKAEDVRIDYIGLNSLHLDIANMDPSHVKDLNEVVLRVAIRTKDKNEAEKIIPEIAPLQLNGPPGASFFGGRARVQEVIGLWPTLIPRDAVKLSSKILKIE